MDETDRNRTSPFAFTGNKFEFRAVGSSQTCAPAMIILNLILADQLTQFKKDVDALIAKKKVKEEAILQVLKGYIKESKNILFEGNNYSDEWVNEARRRGLSNLSTTPTGLKAMVSKKSIELFEAYKVLSKREMKARHEISLEDYIKKIQIESRVLGELATSHVIPAAVDYLNTLCDSVNNLKNVLDQKTFAKVSTTQVDAITKIADHIQQINLLTDKMLEARKTANQISDTEEKAFAYCAKVFSLFEQIRLHADKLELLVDDQLWTLPKYREMLFIR
jgi:glutamine synthetase